MERGVSEPLETEEEINRLHNEKMARRKAVRERMLAAKTEERGLLIVHTGKGKGKSTAAFGLVLRCLGHGMRVRIVQFVKGVWQTGERMALERFGDLVTCRAMGEGFTWDTQDRAATDLKFGYYGVPGLDTMRGRKGGRESRRNPRVSNNGSGIRTPDPSRKGAAFSVSHHAEFVDAPPLRIPSNAAPL